jgi:hypothetical protein
MGPEGRSLRPHPVHEAAESRARTKRLTRGPRRLDRGEVPRVERLSRRCGVPIYKGRTVNPHHDLLGNGIHRLIVSHLLRLRECECIDLDEGRCKEMDGFVQRASRLRALPEGYQPASARMGGAIFQRAALDGDAQGWAFRSDGRTRIARRRYPYMVSELSRRTRHRREHF